MRSAPLVSVVTPCRNPGARLLRCLECVAAQTYSQVEHVVVDAASIDGTVDVLRSSGVTYISEPDRGQTDALNKGFALARGEWLTWLNADDTLIPNAVELALNAAAHTPDAGWVYGPCEILTESERYVWTPPERITAATLERGNVITQPGTFVARWALDRIGPLDEDLDLAMDYDLWLRLVDAGVPAAYVPEALATFEVHSESKTGSVPHAHWDIEIVSVLYKRGHPAAGAAMLGRVAANLARGEGRQVDRTTLESQIDRMLQSDVAATFPVDAKIVRAAAYAEVAEREFYATPRHVRHLLRWEPWSDRRTRSRLLLMLGAAWGRLVRRVTKGLRS